MPAEAHPQTRVAGDSPPAPLPADVAAELEPPGRLSVTVVEEDGDWSGFGALNEAIRQAAAALARHGLMSVAPGSEASVVLGSDALVRRLNRTYRGKDAATNVLSFPFQRPPGAGPEEGAYLGDVVLAAETVQLEADERGIERKQHLQHLVVHGLLHLLGYDHDTDSEAEAMERLEVDILATIGVSDPYAAAAVP
ncbi:MAG: rRNA maturation RNase YbeY [Alphaproteobacteria bacterium]|nr:MAG: rRNA maturation RNase YbeY [Alphaproteobacteria bacterium]